MPATTGSFLDMGSRPGRPYAVHRVRDHKDGKRAYVTRGYSRLAEHVSPQRVKITDLRDGTVRVYDTRTGRRTDGYPPDPMDLRLLSAILYGPVCC